MNVHSLRGIMSKPDKREEIVRAAMELIAENGFHGAPMAMIAVRAGVGAGTIYRYFASKEDLINKLYLELEERLHGSLIQGYDAEKSVRERFVHLGSMFIQYCIANPLDFRYLEQFHNSPFGEAHRRDKCFGNAPERDLYRELFDDAVAQKHIKDFPLPLQFALAFGPLILVLRDHILGFVTLDESLIKKIVEACWDGLER